MATAIQQVIEFYEETMESADPRGMDYPFLQSGAPNLVNILIYLFIVTYAGPRFMRHREAFILKKPIMIYNFVMVIFSAYMFFLFLAGGWAGDYSLGCQKCDYSTSPTAIRMFQACYLFWISKHIEFLDTYFFILRKKTEQISFLHVYHHSFMAYIWWWGVKFSPGGLGSFHCLLNTFVHTVMYSYYGLAGLGPKYRKYLWWKKYLTAMQMIQFVIVFAHTVNILLMQECEYPKAFKFIITFSAVAFFSLFANFWVRAYTQKSKNSSRRNLKNEPNQNEMENNCKKEN